MLGAPVGWHKRPRCSWKMIPVDVVVRFLKSLVSMLLFGIVGPIFIAVYFLAGRDEEINWMLYGGVGITILMVAIAFLITVARTRSAERTRRIEAFGVPASAQVLSVTETGATVNDQPVVKLSLSIQGAGIEPFETDTIARVSVLKTSDLAGRKLVVRVEPGTKNFEIDWEQSALLSRPRPAPATTGTSVADRLTELDQLKAASLVTEAEYALKRAEILADL